MTPEETLKVKSLKDRSDVFNYIVEHLRKQGTRSIFIDFEGDENCLYRGDEGTMCAAGCLMTDDEYHPSLEGNAIDHLLKMKRLSPSLDDRIKPNLNMLMDLQNFHDSILQYEDDGAFTESTEVHICELRGKWNIKKS